MQPVDVEAQEEDHREDALCRVQGRRKGRVPGTVALRILYVFPAFSSHNYSQPRSFSLAFIQSPKLSVVCRGVSTSYVSVTFILTNCCFISYEILIAVSFYEVLLVVIVTIVLS